MMPLCAPSLAYLGVTNAFAPLRLLPRSARDKDAEILALRHQITVLRRHLDGQRIRFQQRPAEWYVLDMQERSWGGLVAHNEQGFNIGKPPYGYRVVAEAHPVPAKAAEGKVKRRLVSDPVRGPAVTHIFAWRTAQKLSYDEIAQRLNADPDRYPPPEPIPGRGRRAIGAWTKGLHA
jgi:hypothetical protein